MKKVERKKVERLEEATFRLHGKYAEFLQAYKKAPEDQQKAIRYLLGLEPNPFAKPVRRLTHGQIIPVKKRT